MNDKPTPDRRDFTQHEKESKRLIVHLFNALNTTANHGLPAMDVPLREEGVPIGGIEVRLCKNVPHRFHLEPGNRNVEVKADGVATVVLLPPLDIHAMLVCEFN